uniref:Uncharacterized protein n=1 Tax=Micrurus carvalhoi TaxID=3147026 RepID=A0A2H6N5K2_9SAUR
MLHWSQTIIKKYVMRSISHCTIKDLSMSIPEKDNLSEGVPDYLLVLTRHQFKVCLVPFRTVCTYLYLFSFKRNMTHIFLFPLGIKRDVLFPRPPFYSHFLTLNLMEKSNFIFLQEGFCFN